MQDQIYAVDPSSVISEIIDGEAIIMDLKTGAYFSADGVGAHVWRWVTLGASRAQVIDWTSACYPHETGVKAAVEAFLDQVVENDLVAVLPAAGTSVVALDHINGAYQPPLLSVHTDMEDLITLDPIHDVSETTGWPIRKVD